MTTLKERTIRERLMARRRKLLDRYRGELERGEQQEPEPELVDAATAQWEARVLSAMSHADAQSLDEVIAAIQRLDTGAYGVCLGCGARIEPARLRAVPEAAQCVECVSFAEEQQPRWVSSVG